MGIVSLCYNIPKVILIEHIHSYFFPDHMVPLSLTLIPKFSPAGPSDSAWNLHSAAEIEAQRRREVLRRTMRSGTPHDDADSAAEDAHPPSVSFTAASDYEERVASQIKGYFKAYIASARAVMLLANAFGYDVVYLGWWNMLLVDRLCTSEVVEVGGAEEVATGGGEASSVGEDRDSSRGVRSSSRGAGRPDEYDSEALSSVFADEPETRDRGAAAEDPRSSSRRGMSPEDPLNQFETIVETLVQDILVLSPEDPLNQFDIGFVSARARQLLSSPAQAGAGAAGVDGHVDEDLRQAREEDPDGEGRASPRLGPDEDPLEVPVLVPTSRSPSVAQSTATTRSRLQHLFAHKNDLFALCNLYARHTHRHYWQAPVLFALHKNLCNVPTGLMVGFGSAEITEKYWMRFLVGDKEGEAVLKRMIRDPDVEF